MKFTKQKLKQIIKEEIVRLNEASVQTFLGLPSVGKIDSARLIAAVTEKINSGEVEKLEQTQPELMSQLSQFLDARVRDEKDQTLRTQLKELRDQFDQIRGKGTSPQMRSRQQKNRAWHRQQAQSEEPGYKDFYAGQLEERNNMKLTITNLQQIIEEELKELADESIDENISDNPLAEGFTKLTMLIRKLEEEHGEENDLVDELREIQSLIDMEITGHPRVDDPIDYERLEEIKKTVKEEKNES